MVFRGRPRPVGIRHWRERTGRQQHRGAGKQPSFHDYTYLMLHACCTATEGLDGTRRCRIKAPTCCAAIKLWPNDKPAQLLITCLCGKPTHECWYCIAIII